MKERCVILCGQILMSNQVGGLLHEELDIFLGEILLRNGIELTQSR